MTTCYLPSCRCNRRHKRVRDRSEQVDVDRRLESQRRRLLDAVQWHNYTASLGFPDTDGWSSITVNNVSAQIMVQDGWLFLQDINQESTFVKLPKRRRDVAKHLAEAIIHKEERRSQALARQEAWALKEKQAVDEQTAEAKAKKDRQEATQNAVNALIVNLSGGVRGHGDSYGMVSLTFPHLTVTQAKDLLDAAVKTKVIYELKSNK